ncbi:MAG: FG-GAP repeat domain-containing protein, partial [Halobacteriaceae archaeon]
FTLYALDEHGEPVFTYETDGAIVSSPTVADLNGDGEKEIVFGSCDNHVYAITNNGDTIWNYETYFWVAAPPVVADVDDDGTQEVIVGSYDHSLYILSSTGEYALDYHPGLGGVVHQRGQYSTAMTKEPGTVEAERIWEYQSPGHIVGCAYDDNCGSIIVNVKEGEVEALGHEK